MAQIKVIHAPSQTSRPIVVAQAVMAHMLYPLDKDADKREAAIYATASAQMAEFGHRYSKGRTPELQQVNGKPPVFAGLQEKWFPELMLSDRNAVSTYVVTALVGYFLVGLHAALVKGRIADASVNRAVALVGHFHMRRPNSKVGSLVPKSGKQILRLWKEANRAAHFWLSYLILKAESGLRDPIYFQFEEFLGRARFFATVLEPLLENPVDFWMAPENSPTHQLETPIFLDEGILKLLEWYKVDEIKGPRIEVPKSSKT